MTETTAHLPPSQPIGYLNLQDSHARTHSPLSNCGEGSPANSLLLKQSYFEKYPDENNDHLLARRWV